MLQDQVRSAVTHDMNPRPSVIPDVWTLARNRFRQLWCLMATLLVSAISRLLPVLQTILLSAATLLIGLVVSAPLVYFYNLAVYGDF